MGFITGYLHPTREQYEEMVEKLGYRLTEKVTLELDRQHNVGLIKGVVIGCICTGIAARFIF